MTGRRGALAGAVLLLLATTACNEDTGAGTPPDSTRAEARGSASMTPKAAVTFVSLGRGDLAWNPRESDFGPQVVVFRSRAAWEKLGGHYQFGQPSPDWQAKLARVDFAKQSIVALTLGEQGSTGYTIELKAIAAGPPLRFEITSTKPEGMAGAMMTHPFHLVIVDATDVPANAEFVLDGKKNEFERHVMK